jgi:tellurite resistance protein
LVGGTEKNVLIAAGQIVFRNTPIMAYRVSKITKNLQKLVPTFFILIAPPAVGFISYFRITNGSIDMLSIFLYSIALFTLFLLLFMIRMYDTKTFFISWWAYTFPLAAVTIATLMMHMAYRNTFTYLTSVALIALTTLVVGFVTFKTLQACKNKQICISEEE